jgi:hypothetical protein
MLARVTDHTYQSGPAGIESNWTVVQFRAFNAQ